MGNFCFICERPLTLEGSTKSYDCAKNNLKIAHHFLVVRRILVVSIVVVRTTTASVERTHLQLVVHGET